MELFGQITQYLSFFNLFLLTVAIVALTFIKKSIDGPPFKVPNVSLKGKIAIVTGGNSGIGFQTVKQLALLGCQVIIGAKDQESAEKCVKNIKSMDSSLEVDYIPLDLSEKTSIQHFVSCLKSEKVDYLVNNAGVMGIPQRKLTKDGVQMQWGVNHLGHFYLTYLLWPKIQKSDFFRIVNVASRGHKQYLGFFQQVKLDFDNINFDKNYDPHLAYSRSKLYNVLFARALSEKIDPKKGLVVSLHPGIVRTNIIRQMTGDGIKGALLSFALKMFWPFWCFFTKNQKQGAATTLFVLLNNVKNGCYYSDSQLSQQNSEVNLAINRQKLWEISEFSLKVKFSPEVQNS